MSAFNKHIVKHHTPRILDERCCEAGRLVASEVAAHSVGVLTEGMLDFHSIILYFAEYLLYGVRQ
jgi:hypothetical protein